MDQINKEGSSTQDAQLELTKYLRALWKIV